MTKKDWLALAVLPVAIVLVGGLVLYALLTQPADKAETIERPDFSAIKDVKEKKRQFFEFVLPLIRRANDRVLEEREFLKQVARKQQTGTALTAKELSSLNALSVKYRLKLDVSTDPAALQNLLERVDTIPASLVLAQAANESAWGTARFARLGNNFFGIWCWSRNCGLVPEKRTAGAKHEVASFDRVANSVSYYLLTLNSHPAYEDLRAIRHDLRQRHKPVTGRALAAGLLLYSERRQAYVDEIREMIEFNNLHRFTRLNTGN